MRPRTILGQFLLSLGGFIKSLSIMAMRPDDLVEFSRLHYAKPEELGQWTGEAMVSSGLNPLEAALIAEVPVTSGRLLLLDIGGGREAIPLVRLGFEVTGVDFVPEMVRRAQENAAKHGVKINGLVQEVANLEVPPASYDIAWLSNSMYSSVPTQRRRLEMLRRIRRALRPGGFFICSFHWEKRGVPHKAEFLRKIFAYVTRGNLWYEPGDMLWLNAEFIHAFSSEADLRAEFAAGGFKVFQLQIPETGVEGGAVLVSEE
jgi:SAM-dependent methyltransferase